MNPHETATTEQQHPALQHADQLMEQVEISRSSSPPMQKEEYTTVSGPTLSHTVEESSSEHDDLVVSVITTHCQRGTTALVPPSSVQHRTRTPDQPTSLLSPTCSPPYDCVGGVVMLDGDDYEEEVNDGASVSSSLSGVFYLDGAEFLESTWSAVVNETNMHMGVGMLAVATTAVIVHPLIFVAGAGVAAASFWAVGMFGDVLQYEYFSDESFRQLFWKDAKPLPPSTSTATPTADDVVPEVTLPEEELQTAKDESKLLDLHEASSSRTDVSEETPRAVSPTATASIDSVVLPPDLKRIRSDSSVTNHQDWIQGHFPPLENQIVSQVELPGLNASKVFEVFFSNDAPFTFREFQKKRGDVDIVYGLWGQCDEAPASLHQDASGPLLDNMRQRTLSFKTLTKSYFGPAYASATKTQRVTIKSKYLVVLESRTRLQGIPFCDRFQVVERWIVETPRHKGPHSLLTVFTEVQFKKGCSFEYQIRKKSFATVSEVIASWCDMAKEALERTAAAQSKRKHGRDEEDEDDYSCPLNVDDGKEKLMARHEEHLRQLEADALNGVELLDSIEVEHASFERAKKVESAPLLESDENEEERRQRTIVKKRSSLGKGLKSARQVFSRKSLLQVLNKGSATSHRRAKDE